MRGRHFSSRKLVKSTTIRRISLGEKDGDNTSSTDGGKPKKKTGKEKSAHYEKERKSEIETAEAETINGDAVGATGVVGERAEGWWFSGT